MKNIIIFGHQKASITNYFFGLKNDKKLNAKIKLYNKNFKNINLEKDNKNFFKIENIYKINLKKKIIITGTSETDFEKNLWDYFRKKKYIFFSYVDSWTNINSRFKDSKSIPNYILVPDKDIKSKIIINLKKKLNSTKVVVTGNPFHSFLYKNRYSYVANKNNIMFLTSYKNINLEILILNKIITYFSTSDLNIYVCLHPREDLNKWKKKLNKNNQIKIIQNNFLNKIKFVKIVLGIDTMGLIEAYYLKKEVYYFKSKDIKNKMMQAQFKKLNIGYFKIIDNKVNLFKNNNKVIKPLSFNYSKLFHYIN